MDRPCQKLEPESFKSGSQVLYSCGKVRGQAGLSPPVRSKRDVSLGLLNRVLSEGLFSSIVVAVERPKRHSPPPRISIRSLKPLIEAFLHFCHHG